MNLTRGGSIPRSRYIQYLAHTVTNSARGARRSSYHEECTGQRAKLMSKAGLVSTQSEAESTGGGEVYGCRHLSAVLRSKGLYA